MKKISTIPFDGTPEQEAQLREVLSKLKSIPGGLMPAMQQAQDIYGYLPKEVQVIIAEEMGVSLSEVYGIATFYAQFALSPKGSYKVAVCLGTACYVKGAGQVLDKFAEIIGIKPGETSQDGLFTLDALRCIGACGIAPAVTINGKVYPKVTVDAIPKIVEEYKAMEANN